VQPAVRQTHCEWRYFHLNTNHYPLRKLKYAGRILAYDHKHRHSSDVGVPYEFQDAYQLLTDFFAEVDRVLREGMKR